MKIFEDSNILKELFKVKTVKYLLGLAIRKPRVTLAMVEEVDL